MTQPDPILTKEQIQSYWQDGYLVLRSFYTKPEIEKLQEAAQSDRKLDDNAVDRADSQGRTSRLALWNHPGDDLYGMFSRNESIVGAVGQLLEDEPYHYHSKIMMKEPRVGGAWEWHQDYGYWYQNGILKPDLCSAMLAVDRATKENGCLQVIRGSHTLGRVDHQLSGDQAGADLERVEIALERMELVHCEMEPGDLLIFHCNTLHRSDANRSDYPRWSMICCYNAKSNDPYKETHHPGYTPISIVPRSAILDFKNFDATASDEGKDWLEAPKDSSATSLGNDRG